MNLSEINTPADLLAANATPDPKQPTEQLDLEQLFELAQEHLDYPDGARLAIAIVNALACFHQETRHELLEAGEPERAAMWAADEGRLHCALLALNELTLD